MIWSEAAAAIGPMTAAILAQAASPTADCVPILWVGGVTGALSAALVHQVRERKATADRLEAILNEDRRWYRERGLPHDHRVEDVVRDIVRGPGASADVGASTDA